MEIPVNHLLKVHNFYPLLDRYEYTDVDELQEVGEEEECDLCSRVWGERDDDDKEPPCYRVKLPCGHILGKHCMEQWLKKQPLHRCTHCRRYLIPSQQPTRPAVPVSGYVRFIECASTDPWFMSIEEDTSRLCHRFFGRSLYEQKLLYGIGLSSGELWRMICRNNVLVIALTAPWYLISLFIMYARTLPYSEGLIIQAESFLIKRFDGVTAYVLASCVPLGFAGTGTLRMIGILENMLWVVLAVFEGLLWVAWAVALVVFIHLTLHIITRPSRTHREQIAFYRFLLDVRFLLDSGKTEATRGRRPTLALPYPLEQADIAAPNLAETSLGFFPRINPTALLQCTRNAPPRRGITVVEAMGRASNTVISISRESILTIVQEQLCRICRISTDLQNRAPSKACLGYRDKFGYKAQYGWRMVRAMLLICPAPQNGGICIQRLHQRDSIQASDALGVGQRSAA
ncbi:hypothetical protein K491DRAFT_683128 [Lophiostoma macrostomum CBS 122681]|uniref:RING-type domain-containing protein n=1 Tax=Lophiostoma macrostomum CBS 122681 TaxID=1314788 RepID=A0A6A6SRM6_9PLEO|nr:hypothetical protein K491DRAFT_683128 [Lophiostoma macrostomum CBS 122681]